MDHGSISVSLHLDSLLGVVMSFRAAFPRVKVLGKEILSCFILWLTIRRRLYTQDRLIAILD